MKKPVLVIDDGEQRVLVRLARFPLSDLARLEAELAQTKQISSIPKILGSMEDHLVAVPLNGDWKRGVAVSSTDPRSVKVWLADCGFECAVPRKLLAHADRLPPYGLSAAERIFFSEVQCYNFQVIVQ